MTSTNEITIASSRLGIVEGHKFLLQDGAYLFINDEFIIYI